MQAEEVAISSTRRICDSSEELIEILDTGGDVIRTAVPPPSIVVEIRTGGVHHSVEHLDVTLAVNQLVALHMDGFHIGWLRHHAEGQCQQ